MTLYIFPVSYISMSAYNLQSVLFLASRLSFNYESIPHYSTRPGEEEYLSTYDPSDYVPGLTRESFVATSDACVFTEVDGVLQVLLVERGNHPFKGHWVLPGGFLDEGEDAALAAVRELEEETGLVGVTPTFVGKSIEPWHDPRYRNLESNTFSFFVEGAPYVAGADDAVDAKWYPVLDVLTGVLPVGFDHYHSIQQALVTHFKTPALTLAA